MLSAGDGDREWMIKFCNLLLLVMEFGRFKLWRLSMEFVVKVVKIGSILKENFVKFAQNKSLKFPWFVLD